MVVEEPVPFRLTMLASVLMSQAEEPDEVSDRLTATEEVVIVVKEAIIVMKESVQRPERRAEEWSVVTVAHGDRVRMLVSMDERW